MYKITYRDRNKQYTRDVSILTLYELIVTQKEIIRLESETSTGNVDLTNQAKECVKLRRQYHNILSSPETIYSYYMNNWLSIFYKEEWCPHR